MNKPTKLYELLEISAIQFPDAIALCFQNEQITYKQLTLDVNLLEAQLSKIQLSKNDRVAIYTFKSINYVVAQFAILKAGAAYIPIDASAPIERNYLIIEDCEAKAIIIDKTFYESFKNNYSIATELDNGLLLLKSKNVNLKQSPNDLAYILYTSGSTGKPKGVMHSNSAALAFINWCTNTFSPTHKDCFSSHAPFHFDLSIFDLFVSIKHGAKLILIEEKVAKQPLLLAQLISEKQITIWYSTPTILNLLATYGKMHKHKYDSLRLVLFAGEVFPINQFLTIKQYWSSPEYYNLYGPTETNVCTYYKIPAHIQDLTSFPIGKCCEHYKSKIIENELFISGAGTMLGYWQSEKLNTESLVKDENNDLWYKTGDIVEQNTSDELIFKGRIDRMIKRNGYRIELSEIEQAFHKHPEITENAVIATTDETNATIITAFLNCKSSDWESVIRMKEYCTKCLPMYMIPNNFMFLKSLPQTPSNKIDYQKLKQLL